ncbi:MAG TPA: hypothetical protein VM580_32805, partial [Labilithrix sp.]|nr:hypothetical protein [Labilithrix sp.]
MNFRTTYRAVSIALCLAAFSADAEAAPKDRAESDEEESSTTARPKRRLARVEESSTADDGAGERPSALPVDDASRALWYRPEASESRPPPRLAYWPGAVALEPQFLLGGARGGVVTTVQLNLPVGAGFGFALGIQASDSARFIGGIDVLRYLGLEFTLTRLNGVGAISAIIAPTFGIQGYGNGSAFGADMYVQPVGIRAVVAPIRTMAELRIGGHVLVGTELGSFGGSEDTALSR